MLLSVVRQSRRQIDALRKLIIVATLALCVPLIDDRAIAEPNRSDFGDYELLGECRTLYHSLSRPGSNFQNTSSPAQRFLDSKPRCGYLYARYLRTRDFLSDPRAIEAADKALRYSRDDFSSLSDIGYTYFLKEAIVSGLDSRMARTSWRSDLTANLRKLQNFRNDYPSFETHIFATCSSFSENPFGASTCTSQPYMPQELRNRVEAANRERDNLESRCDLREPEKRLVTECRTAIEETQRNYPGASEALQPYSDKVKRAETQLAMRDVNDACRFQSQDLTIGDRIQLAENCAVKLETSGRRDDEVATLARGLRREFDLLKNSIVRRSHRGLLATADVCHLKKRFSSAAPSFFNDLACVMPPVEAIKLEEALASFEGENGNERGQQEALASLPAIASGFGKKCHSKDIRKLRIASNLRDKIAALEDPSLKAQSYFGKCPGEIAKMMSALARFNLARFGADEGRTITRSAAEQAGHGDASDLLGADDVLQAWDTRRTDEIAAPATSGSIVTEAKLIVLIANHRAKSIEKHLELRCESQGGPAKAKVMFQWLGSNGTFEKAVEYVRGIALNGPMLSLLSQGKRFEIEQRIKNWKERDKQPCSEFPQSSTLPRVSANGRGAEVIAGEYEGEQSLNEESSARVKDLSEQSLPRRNPVRSGGFEPAVVDQIADTISENDRYVQVPPPRAVSRPESGHLIRLPPGCRRGDGYDLGATCVEQISRLHGLNSEQEWEGRVLAENLRIVPGRLPADFVNFIVENVNEIVNQATMATTTFCDSGTEGLARGRPSVTPSYHQSLEDLIYDIELITQLFDFGTQERLRRLAVKLENCVK